MAPCVASTQCSCLDSIWVPAWCVCTAGVHRQPGAHLVCRVHHAQHCLWHAWRLRQCISGHGNPQSCCCIIICAGQERCVRITTSTSHAKPASSCCITKFLPSFLRCHHHRRCYSCAVTSLLVHMCKGSFATQSHLSEAELYCEHARDCWCTVVRVMLSASSCRSTSMISLQNV